MLLAAPAVVAALLLVAFPKLLTGDYMSAKVISIEDYGDGIAIEFDAWHSSGASCGATVPIGPFRGLGVSDHSRRHWTDIIPTWPKRKSLVVNLGIDVEELPADVKNLQDLLNVKEGETYRIIPRQPLELARARGNDGSEDHCILEVSRGSRLGI